VTSIGQQRQRIGQPAAHSLRGHIRCDQGEGEQEPPAVREPLSGMSMPGVVVMAMFVHRGIVTFDPGARVALPGNGRQPRFAAAEYRLKDHLTYYGSPAMSEANRREFICTTAAGLAAASIAGHVLADQEDSPDGLPKRPLGKTGEKVSILCLGGWHIGAIEEGLAIRIMHEAIDGGLTFFDNAWDYHDGGSETVMGKALADGRRDKVFLMTKNCDRDYKGSLKHLEDSLRRLQTDRIDLWQFHEINYDNDPDWVFEKGGVRAALEAQKAGKVRYIGFTGHKHPEIHMKMLAKANKDFAWDTAQMPINVMDAHYRSFQKVVVPECNKQGVGVLGMKSLAGGFPKGRLAETAGLNAVDCRRYALSLPISSLVVGIASLADLKQDLGLARGFQPMPQAEMQKLLAQVRPEAADGRHELFKSTQNFDGPYHRIQHGFVVEKVSS
jgi:aryl-alcohol dehydrogenase-like predicted oxidoreductase